LWRDVQTPMDEAIYRYMREVEDRHWWFVGRRQIVEQVLKTLPLPSSARILDAGCGTGGNLAMLSSFGEVTGIERDHWAMAMAMARGPWRIESANFPAEVPEFSEKFDLIVLLDVLEHIAEDAATLRTLRGLLAPGGYVIITVPAFQFLWSRHDVEHHHSAATPQAVCETLSRRAGCVSNFSVITTPGCSL
jgi:2-polyprenyl-3-methyl-5-hydroxy-6-metoxy-1,4-benzoquinol methylase